MNREDVLRMAREAEASFETAESMFKFAALIVGAERERIASQWDALHDKYMKDPLRRQMMLSYELVAQMIRGKV